jgi:hypothetical protein
MRAQQKQQTMVNEAPTKCPGSFEKDNKTDHFY